MLPPTVRFLAPSSLGLAGAKSGFDRVGLHRAFREPGEEERSAWTTDRVSAGARAALALLAVAFACGAEATERFSATLRVNEEVVELEDAEVLERFGAIYVILGDRSLAASDWDARSVDGYRGIHVVLDETGEAWEYGVGHVYHPALTAIPFEIPEEASLQVERVGERGYVGSLTLEESTLPDPGVELAFDVSFEFELANPCGPAEIRGDESAPARAFSQLYQDYAQCRFTAMPESLAPDLAEKWSEELEGENGEQTIAELMEVQGMVPRVLDVAVVRSDESEAVLTVTFNEDPTTKEEVVIKKLAGGWKLASGLFF